MEEISLVTNGHVEALGATKELILQLMVMAAGVFAIFAGFVGATAPASLTKSPVIVALSAFGVSICAGYVAFGGVITSYDTETFNAFSGVIILFGITQLLSFLVGGIALIVSIVKIIG